MPVRISILSGSRQGEQFETSLSQFRIGGDATCDLSLDPSADAGAKDRIVTLDLRDDGWYVVGTASPGMRLNDKAFESNRRIRSGDVIRFSPLGPELSFELIAAPRAQVGGVHSTTQGSREDAAALPTAAIWRWGIAGLAISILLVLLGFAVFRSTDQSVAVAEPAASAPLRSVDLASPPAPPKAVATNAPPPKSTESPAEAQAESSKTLGATNVSETPPVIPKAEKGWPATLHRLAGAVITLAVEQPRTYSTWPFATACAIQGNFVLTSANVATELQRFKEKGWKIWAINTATGTKAEISNLRIHAGFLASQGQPDKQVYFDVALGETVTELPVVAQLATPEDLDALESGVALGCIAAAPEIQVLGRFESIEPEIYPVRALVVTTLPPSPGPRLLHLKGEFPRKPFGGVIVNADGKVCAVFADSAPAPSDAKLDLKLSYAPVVEPALMVAGKTLGQSEIWVSPAQAAPENSDSQPK